MTDLKKTENTTLNRKADRGSYDVEIINNILDSTFLCHISFVIEGRPFILPTLYGRKNDRIFIHGSVGATMLRLLKDGAELCFSVTLMDGLVLARSAFHHSMNYRSVILFGKATLVESDEEKNEAFKAIFDNIISKRWEEVRLPNASELKKTMVLSIPIEEASAKIRTGDPIDDEEDMALPVWAGVLPIELKPGKPVADPLLPNNIPVPDYVLNYNKYKV